MADDRHHHGNEASGPAAPGNGHQHSPGRHSPGRHSLGRLAPIHRRGGSPQLYDLGRRRFLRDVGGGTLAVALLGPALISCSESAGPAAVPTSESSATGPADPGRLQWRQVALGNVSAYVLVRGSEAAVVDTGNPGSASRIAESLALLGTDWTRVRHVVLTHAHPDHVGSLGDVVASAPSAAVHAGAADIDAIDSAVTIEPAADGDDIFGLEVIATPGHTPGSIAVIDHGIGLLVAGDAINGNEDGTEITGPNPAYTADMDTAWASVRTLAGYRFETAVFGHGNPYTPGASAAVAVLV